MSRKNIDGNLLTAKVADESKIQFEKFLFLIVKSNIEKFKEYSVTSERLDKFLGHYVF